jgi:hypothetical protein
MTVRGAGSGNGTVAGPAQVAPGNGSPGAVVEGLFATISAKHYAAECAYVEPDKQTLCKTAVATLLSSTTPSFQNAGIGYVAIDGDKALVGTTGKFCVTGQKPECYTNNDPAAIFSGKKPFAALWADANKASSQNVYSLAPCIKINGKWYLYCCPPARSSGTGRPAGPSCPASWASGRARRCQARSRPGTSGRC